MTYQVVSTVTAPAVSYDLSTLAAVKEELNITDGSKDLILKRYLTGASAAISQECNRIFQVETVQNLFIVKSDASSWLLVSRADPLQLSRWPVVHVSSVTIDGVSMVEGVDFVVDKTAGQLLRLDGSGRSLPWCGSQMAVVFDAGFAPVPADIEDAVIRMVTKRWSAKGRDATLKAENIPGVLDRQFWIATGSDAGNMTPDIADIVDGYRIPVMA